MKPFQLKEINPLGNGTIVITLPALSFEQTLQQYLKKAAKLPGAQKAGRDDKKLGSDKKLRQFFKHYTQKNKLLFQRTSLKGETCQHENNCKSFDVSKNLVPPDISSEHFLKDKAQCASSCRNLQSTPPSDFEPCSVNNTVKWQPENHNVFLGDSLTLQARGEQCHEKYDNTSTRRWHTYIGDNSFLLSFNQHPSYPNDSPDPIFYKFMNSSLDDEFISKITFTNITGNISAHLIRFANGFSNYRSTSSKFTTVYSYFPSDFSFTSAHFAQFQAYVRDLIEENGGEPSGIHAIIIGIFAGVIVSGFGIGGIYWFIKKKQKRGYYFFPTKDTRENESTNAEQLNMLAEVITNADMTNTLDNQNENP